MDDAETKKPSFAVEDYPKIVARILEGLAEHMAGKGRALKALLI
jgi:hypothetical protein